MADIDQDNGQNDGVRKFSMGFAPREPIPQPERDSNNATPDAESGSPEPTSPESGDQDNGT